MEINVKASQVGVGQEAALTDIAQQPQTTPAAAIVADKNLSISSMSDFEALLEKLKLEHEKTKDKQISSQFASALALLASQYNGITAAQQKAIGDVVAATEKRDSAQEILNSTQKCRDNSALELNDMTQKLSALELEIKTLQLEKMVENSVVTPEERKKAEDQKRADAEHKKAAEDVAEQKEKSLDVEEAEQEKVDSTIEEIDKEAKQKEIEALKKEIEAKKNELAGLDAALNIAAAGVTSAGEALQLAVSKLDVAMAKVVVSAVRQLANEIAIAAEMREESGEKVDKPNAIIEAIGEWADKLEEMSDEERMDKLAKLSDDMQALMRMERLVKADELAGYQEMI